MKGRVKWFNCRKGYRFIERKERKEGEDVFAYFSEIVGEGFKSLNEGEVVEFEISNSVKGPVAKNIRVIDE